MLNVIRKKYQVHPFHMVLPSIWPLYTSISLLCITASCVLTIHGFSSSKYFLYISINIVIFSMLFWFRDIISESTYLGNHTLAVQRGLYIGIALFIISEALFFFAIFWTFFHSALSPTIDLGGQWPPKGIEAINALELPTLNTIILLSSAITVTFSHHSVIQGMRKGALAGLLLTIFLAMLFTGLQAIEYSVSSFTISDGIYGSCFYFGTGFHGIHVIIGTIFLAISMWRILLYQITETHHLGYESAIFYWHFVDIVWIILFIAVYFWGS